MCLPPLSHTRQLLPQGSFKRGNIFFFIFVNFVAAFDNISSCSETDSEEHAREDTPSSSCGPFTQQDEDHLDRLDKERRRWRLKKRKS